MELQLARVGFNANEKVPVLQTQRGGYGSSRREQEKGNDVIKKQVISLGCSFKLVDSVLCWPLGGRFSSS